MKDNNMIGVALVVDGIQVQVRTAPHIVKSVVDQFRDDAMPTKLILTCQLTGARFVFRSCDVAAAWEVVFTDQQLAQLQQQEEKSANRIPNYRLPHSGN